MRLLRSESTFLEGCHSGIAVPATVCGSTVPYGTVGDVGDGRDPRREGEEGGEGQREKKWKGDWLPHRESKRPKSSLLSGSSCMNLGLDRQKLSRDRIRNRNGRWGVEKDAAQMSPKVETRRLFDCLLEGMVSRLMGRYCSPLVLASTPPKSHAAVFPRVGNVPPCNP